tara:strand:- start:3935 stop:6586 length:2652 start_codon:yes stop_codon:yes gene_type:complete
MANKKVQIEVFDFTSGDSVQSISIVDGGEFEASSVSDIVVIIDNGSGQPNPITSATVSVTASGAGTVASPFVITGLTITNAGSGYLSTVRVLVTTTSGASGVLTDAILQANLDTGVIGFLDITDSQNFPLSMNFTISDGKELESRFGDFSKTFEVPATKNNNRLFRHIYRADIVNDKNVFALKDCRILVDGINFFTGKIQIKGSIQDKNPKSYSCVITGGNATWVSLIKNKNLCDLEFANTSTQTFDYTTIENSFNKTQANSEIVYPLVSYGDFYPTSANGGVNLQDETDDSQDWRGWFWVYNLLKEIFKNIGYTISSNFIETADFKKLITHFGWEVPISDAENLNETYKLEAKRVGQTQSTAQLIGCTNLLNISGTGANIGQDFTNQTLVFNTEVSDISNAHNTTTGVWTCQRGGFYSFSSKINALFAVSTFSNAFLYDLKMTLKIVHKDSGGAVLNTFKNEFVDIFNSRLPQAFYHYYNNISVQTPDFMIIKANETVQTQIDIETNARTGSFKFGFAFVDWTSFPTFDNEPRMIAIFDATRINIGYDFQLHDVLPCNVKQIDFIKGVAHLFNLQFYTDVNSKKVYVEPYNDFYNDFSTAYNWSSKVDYQQPIEDRYEIGLKEEIVFKYKNDSTDKYLEYLNTDENGNVLLNPLFSYYQSLGRNFPKGKLTFENPLFAPTIQTWDNDVRDGTNINGVLIPAMWTEIVLENTIGSESAAFQPVERPDKGFNYEPRIAYYHGLVQNPNNTNYQTRWSSKELNSAGNPITFQNLVYPRATFVDYEDSSFASLSYNDEIISPPRSGTSTTVKGLYSVYYKKMIQQLIKSPRIRTLNLNLKIKDVRNIDLRNLVMIDGQYYRINKIVDFSPAKNITTKVELIQWFEV